jgi:hypothetical protein
MVNRLFTAAVLSGLVALAIGAAEVSTVVLDDFEAYESGVAIATSATSMPWGRYGHAVNDNPTATSQKSRVITGEISGVFPLGWAPMDEPARTSATLRKNFEEPMNLGRHRTVAVKLRSMSPQTETTVTLVITDGTTSFGSKAAQPLTADVQDLKFDLAADALERSDGKGKLDEVLANAKGVGFRFANKGKASTETINIDDVRLLTTSAEKP